MKFDGCFFEGEKRDGFYISPLMKRAWAAQLEVLALIDDICVRNNIEYFASAGTLLGAIRHGGFIPWDDDLDIEMKRLDYERFLKIAQRELPSEFAIKNSATDSEWKGCFSRVVNTESIPLKGEALKTFHGFPFSVGVDIFPIDYLPVDKSEEEAVLALYTAVYILAQDWDKEELTEEEKMQSLQEIGKYCNYIFTQEQPYRQQLWNLAGRIAAMYWDTSYEAKELAPIYNLANSRKFRFPVSWYKKTIRVPFENTTIPVQGGCEDILSLHFGTDYMVPKKVPNHEYPFYKKQIKLWTENIERKKKLAQINSKSVSRDSAESIIDEKTEEVLPKEWMDMMYSEGKRKKILLYHTSVESLICQENFVDDKLRYVFKLCQENDDILLWWLSVDLEQLKFSFVNETIPQLISVCEKLKEEFLDGNFGILDESEDINRAVRIADAYYGDEGELLDLFKKSGKPIMIQEYEIIE